MFPFRYWIFLLDYGFVSLNKFPGYNLKWFPCEFFLAWPSLNYFLILCIHCGAVDCLVDSGTTHTILKNKCYFINFTPNVTSLTTISGPSTLVEGFGKAQTSWTLLSFKDIRENKFHIETARENGIEYQYIASNQYD